MAVNFDTYSTETDTPQNEDGKSFKFPSVSSPQHDQESDDSSFMFSNSGKQPADMKKLKAAGKSVVLNSEPQMIMMDPTTYELMK